MSLRTVEMVLWVSAVLSAAGAACLSLELAAQDTLHVYVRTAAISNYRVDYDTGSGFSLTDGMENIVFPSESENGIARVNFAVSPRTRRLRLQLGGALSIVRICLERSLIASSCVNGAELAPFASELHNANIARNGRELDFVATGASPSMVLNAGVIPALQPAGVPVARAALFIAGAMFLFCACVALLRPVKKWIKADAILVFAAAASLRGLMVCLYKPGTVSDSDWFLRYLQFHIYGQPGSRGIVYPLFTTLFGPHRDALFTAQFSMGAVSAVLALILIRSFKPASRWDMLWALLATSFPVLIGMEALVLSEGFTLFLILALLLALRGLMENPRSAMAAAGLGSWCALLGHTKPQFAFVLFLCAIALACPAFWTVGGWREAARRTVLFGIPAMALQVLALALNLTCGNYLGTSSVLGYSLFNHAQQSVTCPSNSDPHIRFYCEARVALGPNQSSTSYTAWLMYPAIHQLQEPFYRVTEDYQRLSLQIIAQHPAAYATTVLHSFVDFWTKEVPMTRSVYLQGDRNHPGLRAFMPRVLSTERLVRDAVAAAYFILSVMVIAKRAWPPRTEMVFWIAMTGTLIGSSVIQALAESSPENSRFAVPTEPLLWIGIAYSFMLLKSRTPARA